MPVEVDRIVANMQGLVPIERFGLRELEEIRLVLRGGSVIDWRRLNFRDRAEADAFLRLCLFDPDLAADAAKLKAIHGEAVAYLRSVFRYPIDPVVASPAEVHDLLLMASGEGPHRRHRRMACIVLKVMHTIFHTEARETLFNAPVSEKDVARLVDVRVAACKERMRRDRVPVVEFHGSVKTRESVITKLLSKRETLAAQLFDKVRYRIVTERYEHILPVLHYLTTHLFPFSFTLPGQTQNTLFSFKRLVERTPSLRGLIHDLQFDHLLEERELREMRRRPGAVNEFSGRTYRVLNFVADVPVRLDDFLCRLDGDVPSAVRSGPQIVFQPVEFQLMDRETAIRNEEGENSHERYKRRQRWKVRRRLSSGLVVPGKTRRTPGAGPGRDSQDGASRMPHSTTVEPKGEVKLTSRCDICGATGETVVLPDRDPPNRFCLRCAVEYGSETADPYEEG